MSLNTSHTPDGRGVLIYNGEMILLYSSNVKLSFEGGSSPSFKGGKSGALYLTSHRIIFMNGPSKDSLRSFSMPFHLLQGVKLEQPLLAPNYLKGIIGAVPGGNFEGEVTWKLSFPKGGCVDFGQALLRANAMASQARPFAAPPMYAAPSCNYYCAPPTYYTPPPGGINGFQAPTHAFPEQPPSSNIYMYESPPPYGGIGGQTAPYPAGGLQYAGSVGPAPAMGVPSSTYPQVYQQPPAYGAPAPGYGAPAAGYGTPAPNQQPPGYNAYQQAGPLPEKH